MSKGSLILAGGGALAGAIVVAVVIVLLGGGGGSSGAAAAETPTSQALAAAASATQAPTQAPAPTSTPVPPSPVPQLPDRTNCNDIRGTDYRSASEEAFFRANCAGTGAPAPTARPATGAPPPPAPASGSQSNNVEAEARYRNQAAAQLAYFSAQIRQQVGATGGLDGQAAILQISSLLTNFINALDSLQPVPPRFQGVHNALRVSLVDFRTQIQIGLTIKTSAQLLAWVPKMFAAADNADHAISDFNIVVGTKVPGLR